MLNRSKLFIILLFGLINGFTLMITGNSLNYWLAKENVNLQSIGIFAFILLPYSINFLFAPIFDTLSLGWFSKLLGHRLSWLCLIQFLLSCTIFLLSILNPKHNLMLFALIGLGIAWLSAVQDTLLGALRTEIIPRKSQGATAGIYIFGYRTGMLISGSGAIYCSSYVGWNNIYKIFAFLVLCYSAILVISILSLKHQQFQEIPTIQPFQKKWFNIADFIQNILKPVGSFSFVFTIIVFLILYRLPDDLLNIMLNPFLLHIGYNEFEVATASKFLGVIFAMIGGLIASLIMREKNILSSLLLFGIIHAISHSLFILQEIYGKNLMLLFIAASCQSITGGMAMAAYIGFIASLCSGKFRATQYSFFTSMMGFSRSTFPAFSGYIVVQYGWQNFFIFIMIMTIPSLLILTKLITAKGSKI